MIDNDHGSEFMCFLPSFPLLTYYLSSVTLWAMEKRNTLPIRVTITDCIESTTTELFNGEATFDGQTISFDHGSTRYTISKLGKHYLTIDTTGEMSYTLDLKPQMKLNSELNVESFTIPIMVNTISMDLSSFYWDVIYTIHQSDALLYHNHLRIDFLLN